MRVANFIATNPAGWEFPQMTVKSKGIPPQKSLNSGLGITFPETKSSPLKMDGGRWFISFQDGLFAGAKMLISGSV